jgi:hypothetical protein
LRVTVLKFAAAHGRAAYTARMNVDLLEHPDELQRAYAMATPAARLRVIRQRLASAHGEMGSTRLVTIVSAVEALARSLVVHSAGRPASTAEMRHRQFRATGPVDLVEEVLRLRGAPPAAQHFDGDEWDFFQVATRYRDLIVHECTYVGQDRHPYLIAAAETVLHGLIELAGLEFRPKPVG